MTKGSNKIPKELSVIIILALISIGVKAQISHGGKPIDLNGTTDVVVLESDANTESLKSEVTYGKGPMKYAYTINVNYSTSNSGQWYDLEDGNLVWRLSLKSDGALSLSIIFSSFKLQEGAKVFLYNKDYSIVLGAFTKENNKSFGSLATAPIIGDEIIVELQSPHESAFDNELVVGSVFHDFVGIMKYLKNDDRFGYAGECNVDVSCDYVVPEEIRRSVCKLLINGFLCSGTLVNNTNNDGRALMLTAAHCISNEAEANNTLLYFNFDVPNCTDSIAGTDQQQLSGASLLAAATDLDFSLIELSEVPPESYRPYWAGWDISSSINGPVYCVHHPDGDVKKVSWSGGDPVSTTFDYVGFESDSHWQITSWASGTTEGGSSGSGLFSPDNKLIGTLSGGSASCNYPYDDYFARLNKGWDFYSETSKQIANWLAPNSSATSLEGLDFYGGDIQRVSPINDETFPQLLYSNQFLGPWSGTNSMGYDAFAEYYSDYGSATIHGVYIIPAICDESSDETINVKIWNAISGEPADVAFEENDIPLMELKRREYFVDIESPVEINGEFFIGIELNNPASSDTIALYNVIKNIGSLANDRAFIRDQGSWKSLSSVSSSEENSSFWIDFLGSNLDTVTEIDTLVEKQVVIQPNPIVDGYVNYVTNLEHLTSIEMYNVNGSLVKIYQRNGQKKGQLSVSPAVMSGVYIMVFKNYYQSIVVKVLLLR